MFAPLATLLPYDGGAADAAGIVALGGGTLVSSAYSDDPVWLGGYLAGAGSTTGRIYIGSESDLFDLTGCSVVIAPYSNSQQQIVGAIGVIGPTRIDYARIIPMVDYTAKVIGRIIG